MKDDDTLTAKKEGLSLDAVILCGGRGSRLQSVVSDRPKSMAMLRGRPFLEWQLLSLREIGVKNIVLCTGYMGLRIRDHFGDGGDFGMRIEYSDEKDARGTGGALRSARALFHSDPVLVLNGDSWCDIDMEKLIRFHEFQHAAGTLALTRVDHPERYGQVVLGHNQEVTGFSEKGKAEVPGWINAGMYVLSYPFVESIPEESCISLEHDVFPGWIEKGLFGYSGEHHFFDVGTPDSYAQAEQDFEQVFHLPELHNHSMKQ